jgi:hypothetical protein
VSKLISFNNGPYEFDNGTWIRFADEEFVAIGDELGEIVYWDQNEWIEDPSLVETIVNAVAISISEGGATLRLMLSPEVQDFILEEPNPEAEHAERTAYLSWEPYNTHDHLCRCLNCTGQPDEEENL